MSEKDLSLNHANLASDLLLPQSNPTPLVPGKETAKEPGYFSKLKPGKTLGQLSSRNEQTISLASGKLSPPSQGLNDFLKQLHKEKQQRKNQRAKVFNKDFQ